MLGSIIINIFAYVPFILGGIAIYRWFQKSRYLPQVPRNRNVTSEHRITKWSLTKIAKKIVKKQVLTTEEKRIFKESFGLDPDQYLLQESEKYSSVNFSATNGKPIFGETKIRQNPDGLLYFSVNYQTHPQKTFKLIEYNWDGPRLETSYKTVGTSKNKHLIPIINQKRVSESKTEATTKEYATLGKLTLLDTKTNEKVICEGYIDTVKNNIISGFKLWPYIQPVEQVSVTEQNGQVEDFDTSIRKLKLLLDDQIITEDEFNEKKKQLLNL